VLPVWLTIVRLPVNNLFVEINILIQMDWIIPYEHKMMKYVMFDHFVLIDVIAPIILHCVRDDQLLAKHVLPLLVVQYVRHHHVETE